MQVSGAWTRFIAESCKNRVLTPEPRSNVLRRFPTSPHPLRTSHRAARGVGSDPWVHPSDRSTGVGLGLEVLLGVFAAPGNTREEFTDSLTAQEEIVRAWTIAGSADALALIHARDTDHLEGIILRLQRIPVIARTPTQILLSELVDRSG
ncbi:Lrp/AsnC ligand binding domain-containing protein [Saccharopolyspora shandongensis]|uniref:Lrp/AsnC ligand binding domain-containing protein n=1 Tax=Saccharopolyspora shandongensis TaxID=418495 RepID=UPI00343BB524